MFAVQNGGWCAASLTAAKTFNKYGKSSACKSDGEGGPWANQVYVIKGNYARRVVTYIIYFHVYPQALEMSPCWLASLA